MKIRIKGLEIESISTTNKKNLMFNSIMRGIYKRFSKEGKRNSNNTITNVKFWI